MQISEVLVTVHRVGPNPDPIRDALQSLPGAGHVVVRVRTDGGVEGSAHIGFGRIAGAPEVLAALIEKELAPLVVGQDPALVRALHAAMLRETEYHGSQGLAMFGIAAIDTAIWDCLGKAAGVPCWQLWGGSHREIPAYAMVGWLNYDDEQVQAICRRAVDAGFRAVKLKVGYPTLAQDLRRIEIVRRAVGDDVVLMVDANQSLNTAEALRRGRAFQDAGVLWFEEPLPADDIDGYAELCAALDIPIATGENLYTLQDFGRFLKRDAVDIVQPDLRRAGGPTALLAIGLLAQAFRRPYASHGGDLAQLNVLAALPNTLYLESGIPEPGSPMRLHDGCVPMPQGAGFGW